MSVLSGELEDMPGPDIKGLLIISRATAIVSNSKFYVP